MDLTTRYLGLSLPSPVVASASPLNRNLDTLRTLQDCGAGAVVLPSVFEEQIEFEEDLLDDLVAQGTESFGEAQSFLPSQTAFAFDSTDHLMLTEKAARILKIPVIASLNAMSRNGWVGYAKDLENAGAAAIELNIFYVPSDISIGGDEVEQRYLDIVGSVVSTVDVPVAVKIGPYFSSPGNFAARLSATGAKGLVLFNRFYQPDIDTSTLTLEPNIELSRSFELRLPLLWIGVLSGRVEASLAATTGVWSASDVVKYLLAGADVAMTTSSLLRYGPEHMQKLVDGLTDWLKARNFTSSDAIRGMLSHANVADPVAYERANYISMLQGFVRP